MGTQVQRWMRLAERLDASPAQWSARVDDAATGEVVFEVHADRILSTASVPKLLLLREVACRLDEGSMRTDEPLRRDMGPAMADSGLWQHLATDTLPLDDVARLVGTVSDNWATNVLLARVGGPSGVRGNDVASAGIALLDYVREHRTEQMPPRMSSGSALGCVRLLTSLYRDAVGTRGVDPLTGAASAHPRVGQRVFGWLRDAVDLSMVAGAFGLDPLAHSEPDRGYTVYAKTGTERGVRADVGVASSGSRSVIYAFIANWDDAADLSVRDRILADLHEAGATMRWEVSREKGVVQ